MNPSLFPIRFTGDPNGDGTGGASIWGVEFEDEIDRSVRFDRPGLLAMVSRLHFG